jgi:hypothetical protein
MAPVFKKTVFLQPNQSPPERVIFGVEFRLNSGYDMIKFTDEENRETGKKHKNY